jgi:hypothetical protein
MYKIEFTFLTILATKTKQSATNYLHGQPIPRRVVQHRHMLGGLLFFPFFSLLPLFLKALPIPLAPPGLVSGNLAGRRRQGRETSLHRTIIVLGVGIGVMLPMWRMARSSSPASDLWWRMLVLLVGGNSPHDGGAEQKVLFVGPLKISLMFSAVQI